MPLGHCDNCGQHKDVTRLDIGGGAGVFLCKPCWADEMRWRKERNNSVWNPFDITPYPNKRQ